MLLLGSLTRPELVFSGLPAIDRSELLRVLSEKIVAQGMVRNAVDLHQKLWEREQLGTTGIGSGIAIPHAKIAGLRQEVVAVGLVEPPGSDFGAADGGPVRLVFLVLSPAEAPARHLQVLAAISRWIKTDRHAERLLALPDARAVYRFLQEDSP